jgi:tetratricopeptide (TPR) repeat protein
MLNQKDRIIFMKKIVVLSLSAIIFTACGGTTTVTNTNVTVNRPTAATNAPGATTSANQNNSLVVSSHSTDKNAATTNPATSADQSTSSPMSKPVDVTAMTAKIEKADKDLKAKPDDEKLKKASADAYFERAFALTKAAQYRAALGDFRKGLKLNPDDKEAQSMHDQIIEIFKSIGREPPKEGEEPAPLPIK